jgi:hypothetical protein
VAGFVLVELVAEFAPPLRSLRQGSAAGRRRLNRVAWILGTGFAVVQALGVALQLRGAVFLGEPVLRFGTGPFLGAVAALAGGAFALAFAAALISSQGLSNGFAVLLAVQAVEDVWWFAVRTAGRAWSPDGAVVGLAIAVVGALVVARWARQLPAPAAVVAAYRRARSGLDEASVTAVRRACRVAERRSLGPVMALAALPWATAAFAIPVRLGVEPLLQLAVIMAAAQDLWTEARARAGGPLVPAWSLHAVYTVEPVLEALAAAGIPACARARRFRALFHFFAPFAPIEIMVPSALTAEATDVCERVAVAPPPVPMLEATA